MKMKIFFFSLFFSSLLVPGITYSDIYSDFIKMKGKVEESERALRNLQELNIISFANNEVKKRYSKTLGKLKDASELTIKVGKFFDDRINLCLNEAAELIKIINLYIEPNGFGGYQFKIEFDEIEWKIADRELRSRLLYNFPFLHEFMDDEQVSVSLDESKLQERFTLFKTQIYLDLVEASSINGQDPRINNLVGWCYAKKVYFNEIAYERVITFAEAQSINANLSEGNKINLSKDKSD